MKFHGLRHLSGSIGLAAGETLHEVSRRLGHSTITLTADVYSHVNDERSKQAARDRARLVLDQTG